MSDSVRPHRRQPTRLRHPWDSPGKNTGVGCHFLLQCMKVKSESEVAQSCPTLSDPMDCSLPGSSVHGIFQARVLEWGAVTFSGLHFYRYSNISSPNVQSFVPGPLERAVGTKTDLKAGRNTGPALQKEIPLTCDNPGIPRDRLTSTR